MLAITLNLRARPHSLIAFAKRLSNWSDLSCIGDITFFPCSFFFITPGILTKRKVRMSVRTFLLLPHSILVRLKPMDLLRKINGRCLNSLLLIYLFYYHDERTIPYFYLLPMNKDFFKK